MHHSVLVEAREQLGVGSPFVLWVPGAELKSSDLPPFPLLPAGPCCWNEISSFNTILFRSTFLNILKF